MADKPPQRNGYKLSDHHNNERLFNFHSICSPSSFTKMTDLRCRHRIEENFVFSH
jgi:hypothetical protein